jgi:Xaa-Pro aminopeptidase
VLRRPPNPFGRPREWPFIVPDSDGTIEPVMALAFETPFYGNGVGALMIRDQMLVTMSRERVRAG